MKDCISTPPGPGILAIFGLLFVLVSIALLQLQSAGPDMDRHADIASLKSAAASEMRAAMHRRLASLEAMRATPDISAREEEHQRIIREEENYRTARHRLEELGVDDMERPLLNRLAELMSISQSYNDAAAGLLLRGTASVDELAAAMEEAQHHQGQMLEQQDTLVTLLQENARRTSTSGRKHFLGIQMLLLTLVCIAVLLCLMLARLISRRIKARGRQLSYQASHDILTGLINRREFEVRIERAINHARTHSATHALLYLDLDHFNAVNDTCGQATGDELLRQIGKLIISCIRQRDTLGRLGGDEFGILLENCPLEKAIELAKKLLASIEAFRCTGGEHTLRPGVSIGVVPIDLSTTDLGSTMSAADSACYIAKESGRGRIQIAHHGDRRLQRRHGLMQWATRLTRALEDNRFTLYFQPIIPCSKTTAGGKYIEILLRLVDDDGSIVAPGVFLPAAEKYQLVTKIDRWVIKTAMAWLARESAFNHWPITISINLAGQSVVDPGMFKFIMDQVEKTGISPAQVCFEIKEAAAIENITETTNFILTLRGYGFRFSLDDFGSGLSSFLYLKKLPVDYLKIDGIIVRDILSDPVDRAMVKSISELGQLLGKETIAEFVETMDVAEELKRLGINHLQGYAYCQPQSLDDFVHLMGPRLVIV